MSKSQVRGQEGTTLSKTHTCAHTVSIYVNKVGSSLAIHGLTNRTQPQVSLCPRLPAMRELWNILILGLVLQLSFLICRSLLLSDRVWIRSICMQSRDFRLCARGERLCLLWYRSSQQTRCGVSASVIGRELHGVATTTLWRCCAASFISQISSCAEITFPLIYMFYTIYTNCILFHLLIYKYKSTSTWSPVLGSGRPPSAAVSLCCQENILSHFDSLILSVCRQDDTGSLNPGPHLLGVCSFSFLSRR